MFDGNAFGQEMVAIVREHVAAELGPLRAENTALKEANATLVARVEALEQRELLLPAKGEPGRDVDMDDVAERIESAVQTAVSAIPPPRDGIGLADTIKDAEGNLILVMTDGSTKSLGQIDGKDGLNGRDGITPTFLDAEFSGRTLRLKFDGERGCEFQLATPEYCGVFKEASAYEPGDIVTWAGSAWHCDEPKGLKPGAPDSGWTLMVKAGRPGKDAGK